MMKKMMGLAMSSMAALLIMVANSGVGTCSWVVLYEPDVPESLKK